ncbi:MAG TPA: hypothetical protein VG097_14355, partial [Gemmata sp.]|nr:hypothetical protein [Gemmata sp.]
MRWRWGFLVLLLTLAGCHGLARTPTRPPQEQSTSPTNPANDLPVVSPTIPVLDARELPKLPPRTITGFEGVIFR